MRDENKKGFKKKCGNSWNYSWHLKNNKDEKSPNYIKMLKRELIIVFYENNITYNLQILLS